MCDLIIAALEHLSNTNLPVCIMGDLNLPLMDWTNKSTSDNIHSKFLTFFMSNTFSQAVNFPTRDSNILDIFLVDDPSIISNVRSSPPLGSSDHLCVLFDFELVGNDNNSFSSDTDDAKKYEV